MLGGKRDELEFLFAFPAPHRLRDSCVEGKKRFSVFKLQM